MGQMLSIVIPVYNEVSLVLRVIERVESVPLPDGLRRQIIVVDDGSTDGTFDLLQQNQPDLTLETVSEGDLKIGLEEGIVLGFRTIDSGGKVIGGGLIGAWECLDTATSFSMTATGEDAAVVQLRFDRMADTFSCDGG